MPVAEKFKILGVGNGFRDCLKKKDVSALNSAPMTLEQAVKMYWNLNYVKFTTVGLQGFSSSKGVRAAGNTNTPYNTLREEDAQPKDRIKKVVDDVNFSYFVQYDPLEGPIDITFLYRGEPYDAYSEGYEPCWTESYVSHPYKMYDGPTSDEANFIGYGFSNIGRAGATVYGTSENGDTDWSEELGRVYTEITSFTQGGTVTEKNGIPVIVKEDTSGAGASVIFNGFDFYTYPE
jgi:hypothetical protein